MDVGHDLKGWTGFDQSNFEILRTRIDSNQLGVGGGGGVEEEEESIAQKFHVVLGRSGGWRGCQD